MYVREHLANKSDSVSKNSESVNVAKNNYNCREQVTQPSCQKECSVCNPSVHNYCQYSRSKMKHGVSL